MRTIETHRLLLRPFVAADAGVIQPLADDPEVARPTSQVPSPYTLADAQAWIASHGAAEAAGQGRPWAIERRTDGTLLGAISLELHARDRLGVLGYWLGRASWGQGYATEAAKAVVHWGWAQGLGKVAAEVLAFNAASMVVLARCGLRLEGVLQKHAERDGVRYDVCCFGALRDP